MKTDIYKSGPVYHGIFFLGTLGSLIFVSFGGFLFFIGMYLLSFIFLVIGMLSAYVLLFLFPTEIHISKAGMTYKTVIRSQSVNFSDIKEVKQFYTTRSTLALSSDRDKQKAAMLCVVILKDNPLHILLFGETIRDYKELCSRIVFSSEDIKGNHGKSRNYEDTD